MFAFKSKGLDERQLLIRGNIFKHGLFLLSGLIFVNSMLYNLFGFVWAPDKWGELTFLLLTVAVCSIEFICYDIYPLKQNRQRFLIFFVGLFGVVSIAACIYELVVEKPDILSDGILNTDVMGIVYGCLLLSIPIAYLIKSIHNTKHDAED